HARIMTEATAGILVRRDKMTLGVFFGRVARQPPCATQYARRLPRSPQAGYRPPRHSAVTTPRHPTPRRAGDAPTDRPTDSPARQARTPFRRGARLPASPEGAAYSDLLTTFGEPGIKALDRLVSSCDVLRPQRARYVAALPAEPERPKVPGGVSNRTVCVMLTVLSMALTTAMKRGLVARNVAQLVDRPAIEHREMSTWTPQQAERFREYVRGDRLYACWLLTLAG